MRRLALAGLVLTLVVHLASFVPGIRMSSGLLPVAFFAVFIAFFSTILSANRYRPRFKPARDERSPGWWSEWGRDVEAQNCLSAYAFRSVPGWTKVLSALVFVYVGISFIMGMVLLRDGQPERHGRQFWLQDHGRYVRDITESEFYMYEARGVRFFTGHYLAFALPPVLWFTFVRPRLMAESGASTARLPGD
jgi:hypothetical protein